MSKAFTKEEPGEDELPDELEEEQKPQGSPVITREGYERLQAEFDKLWKVERPKVTNEVMWAAAQGDRSENAEYIYGKRRLREIDRRVRWLKKRLESLEIVEPHPDQKGKVFFGAYVDVKDEDGKRSKYRIVGSDEIDLKRGWISIDAPLAKALLGKKKGDFALVSRPKGEIEVEIVSVRY
ncbi:MAG: transcription elongation factor GreB [Deltaproteobacteria bacterium]|nr:transcription elongation factor GreB [Deltaproteobacteria bacterium]